LFDPNQGIESLESPNLRYQQAEAKMPFESAVIVSAVVVLFSAVMVGMAWGQWRSSLAGTWAEAKKSQQ